MGRPSKRKDEKVESTVVGIRFDPIIWDKFKKITEENNSNPVDLIREHVEETIDKKTRIDREFTADSYRFKYDSSKRRLRWEGYDRSTRKYSMIAEFPQNWLNGLIDDHVGLAQDLIEIRRKYIDKKKKGSGSK